jgi:hypothetical protein
MMKMVGKASRGRRQFLGTLGARHQGTPQSLAFGGKGAEAQRATATGSRPAAE